MQIIIINQTTKCHLRTLRITQIKSKLRNFREDRGTQILKYYSSSNRDNNSKYHKWQISRRKNNPKWKRD